LKVLKNVLLVGNDWLLHVVLGAFFIQQFGWLGLIPSFFSHFLVDEIIHGHIKGVSAKGKLIAKIFEASKGLIAAVLICIIAWIKIDFNYAFLLGCGIAISLSFDFLLEKAFSIDKKMSWKNFNHSLSKKVYNFARILIRLNYFFHWFGRPTKLTKILKLEPLWKETINHNCNVQGNGIVVSWWNILQLLISLPFAYHIFCFLF
jgi:hypothetical protein